MVTLAETMHLAALSQHYGVSDKLVKRWARDRGVKLKEFDFSASSARIWGDHPRGGSIKKPVQRPSKIGVGRRFLQSRPLAGNEEEAAHYLRRHYPAVYHCDRRGRADPKGDHWLCGSLVLTSAELVTRAKDKGWDPDAWKRVPA